MKNAKGDQRIIFKVPRDDKPIPSIIFRCATSQSGTQTFHPIMQLSL